MSKGRNTPPAASQDDGGRGETGERFAAAAGVAHTLGGPVGNKPKAEDVNDAPPPDES